MRILLRALAQGAAFGLAAATVETGLQLIGTLQRGFGPGAGFFLGVSLLEIGLGAALGLVALPALWLRAGRFVHVLVIGILWYGLERWVALDAPLFAPLEFVPPLAGCALVALGVWIAGRRPLLPWGVGLALWVAALFSGPIVLQATRPAIERAALLPAAPAAAPDVVLIVLDTVRAGSVSTYGYERPTAPALDALAREGALFADATSPSTWSLPSHASLFTGRYPSSHGAHAEHQYLDDRFPTLAQVLQANGYETFCFTANAWISDGLGLTRGFAWQDESLRNQAGAGRGFAFIYRLLDRVGLLRDGDKGGAIVVDRFEDWARERPAAAERPAFVFLNFIEAHFPYHQLPHDHLFRFTDRPYAELRQISIDLLGQQFGGRGRAVEEVQQQTVDMYDGGVAYSSDLLARVVEALRARGTLDRTVLVVMADHGEVLGEYGGFFGHGPSFYQPSVGVPLLVRYPQKVPAGARVETPVSTLGVFATILDLAELPPPPTLQVGSLAPLMRGEDASPGPILSELHDGPQMRAFELDDPQMRSDRRYRLLRDGSLKLVVTSKGESLLYDLATDPSESRDLASQRPGDLAHMQARLAAAQRELGLPDIDAKPAVGDDAPELDDVTRERLRALGYTE